MVVNTNKIYGKSTTTGTISANNLSSKVYVVVARGIIAGVYYTSQSANIQKEIISKILNDDGQDDGSVTVEESYLDASSSSNKPYYPPIAPGGGQVSPKVGKITISPNTTWNSTTTRGTAGLDKGETDTIPF